MDTRPHGNGILWKMFNINNVNNVVSDASFQTQVWPFTTDKARLQGREFYNGFSIQDALLFMPDSLFPRPVQKDLIISSTKVLALRGYMVLKTNFLSRNNKVSHFQAEL